MRTRFRRGRQLRQAPELNITAFMNLMVILVPFLLITAVFSRITILELNLPASANSATPPKKGLELEVIVRQARIEIQDRNTGHLKTLRHTGEAYPIEGLSLYLRAVKARFPQVLGASILLEHDIPYEVLVQVMDAVRAADMEDQDGQVVRAELFPEISIGDAPVLAGRARIARNAQP
jgi:biopolymer transport protein ExbD